MPLIDGVLHHVAENNHVNVDRAVAHVRRLALRHEGVDVRPLDLVETQFADHFTPPPERGFLLRDGGIAFHLLRDPGANVREVSFDELRKLRRALQDGQGVVGALHLQPFSYQLWLQILRAAGPFCLIQNR